MDDDRAAELATLVRGFRGQLEWSQRGGNHEVSAAPSPIAVLDGAAGVGSAVAAPPRRLGLAEVREDLGDCTRCKLSTTRQHIVFGVGDPHAPLMFIGEAPGADEDRLGDPFVGKAGQLLDKMTLAMGWPRASVYIANVLKCRPPGNRDPEADEIEACEPFLARQIDAIAPRMIVTLGKPAAQLLLRTRAPISALRGTFHAYRGIKIMPTFHPAYLLRSPERKRETWNDLKQVIAELERMGIATPQPPKA
jgi:DNA polymerase